MPDDTKASSANPAVGPIRIADGLGVASAGLGLPMVAAPRRFADTIGVRLDRKAGAVIAAVGIREFLATATILGMRHRRVGAWSRVGGDALDLALLIRAFVHRRTSSSRLLGAIGFVTAILGADLATALRLTQAEGGFTQPGSGSAGTGAPADRSGGPARVRTAITVLGSEDAVHAAFVQFQWSAFDPVRLEAAGELRFVPAPGDRGTEVHVDFDPSVPAGGVGAALLKVTGSSPDQRVNDELRRFKARFETGVEVRSEKSPEGPSAGRQIAQRPGQPIGASG